MVWDDINARLENLAANSIARALAISLIFHFLLFSSLELAYRLGWMKQSVLASLKLTSRSKPDLRRLNELKKNNPPAARQIPVVFVEVDPAQAVEESPKDSEYYSTHNTRAANPDTKVDSNKPKITGAQDKVAKTTDTARSKPLPLPPEPPAEKQAAVERPKAEPQPLQPKPAEASAKTGSQPGDLTFAKPADVPKLNPEPEKVQVAENAGPPRVRPRTIAAALQQQGLLAGEKMKQDGGMKRFSIAEGLDVKASPFGSYDGAIIAAIQKRWYDLLDERDFARGHVGKVVLTFRLNSNGSITEMRVAENEVTDILALICQRAVLDPAPYAPWPNDMRRLVGADYREVKFTFHHN